MGKNFFINKDRDIIKIFYKQVDFMCIMLAGD